MSINCVDVLDSSVLRFNCFLVFELVVEMGLGKVSICLVCYVILMGT